MKMEGLTGLRKKRVPTYYTEVLPLEDGTNVRTLKFKSYKDNT
jgi:hypothetical protein